MKVGVRKDANITREMVRVTQWMIQERLIFVDQDPFTNTANSLKHFRVEKVYIPFLFFYDL